MILEGRGSEGPVRILLLGYRGPVLPSAMAAVTIANIEPGTPGQPRYRLSSRNGSVDFDAERIEHQAFLPTLFDELHRPFGLRERDRLVVRILLVLLRLPGGGRLLRLWHASRQPKPSNA